MSTPIREERAHTPKYLPGPPPRLRPAQAAPVRRDSSAAGMGNRVGDVVASYPLLIDYGGNWYTACCG
jgi:hypothetical protein